jgi:hypothetical protein
MSNASESSAVAGSSLSNVLKAVDLVVVLMFSAIIVVFFVNLRYVCQMQVNHRLWPDRHFQICCRVLKSVDLVVVLLFSAIIAKGAE